MKTIGEIKEEFSAAREADWNAICQMYETDLRSGVQKLVQQYRKNWMRWKRKASYGTDDAV